MHDSDDAQSGVFASPPCFLHEVDAAYSGLPVIDERQAQDVARWRKAERTRLVAARRRIGEAERARLEAGVIEALRALLHDMRGAAVSWYWPIRGEPDLRPLMRSAERMGLDCALPVVVQRGRPMTFRRWTQGAAMERGIWDIPVPSDGEDLAPDVILAPVVGFDRFCYRLGNGGGYFDRTLAALAKPARAIGVGYAEAEIATIYPQWHDIPMACIVNELGMRAPAVVGVSA